MKKIRCEGNGQYFMIFKLFNLCSPSGYNKITVMEFLQKNKI